MLAQTETVAAPPWTWLVLGEAVRQAVIAGGALILLAVVLQARDGASRAGTSAPQAT
jgi:drug/metabolite transporter (DMT)-like permease